MDAAIEMRDWELMDQLIDEGAPVNASTEGGHTLLTIAAYTGAYTQNREQRQVLAVELLVDRPAGQRGPAVDGYVKYIIPVLCVCVRTCSLVSRRQCMCVHS